MFYLFIRVIISLDRLTTVVRHAPRLVYVTVKNLGFFVDFRVMSRLSTAFIFLR